MVGYKTSGVYTDAINERGVVVGDFPSLLSIELNGTASSDVDSVATMPCANSGAVPSPPGRSYAGAETDLHRLRPAHQRTNPKRWGARAEPGADTTAAGTADE